jgi:hypothetical protein
MGGSIKSPNTDCLFVYYATSKLDIYDKNAVIAIIRTAGLAEIVWFQ